MFIFLFLHCEYGKEKGGKVNQLGWGIKNANTIAKTRWGKATMPNDNRKLQGTKLETSQKVHSK